MPRLRSSFVLSSLVVVAAASPSASHAADRDVHRLAGGCYAAGPAGSVSFKATGLGRYLLVGRDGLLAARDGGVVDDLAVEDAGPAAEWAPRHAGGRSFTFRSTARGRWLAARGGSLSLARSGTRFTLRAAKGCRAFPEADLGVRGRPGRSVNADGTLRGFADTHVHLTADMRAGGRVFGGEPFDRFGIVRALGREADAEEHGADGSLDHTGNLLRDGVPFGTHDTGGWPSFAGWPTHDTNTHQQIYYRWLQRAWMGGLRLTVAEAVEDSIICKVEPRRRYSCDETTAIRGQVRRLRALEEHVDAQHGGRGRGWLRIVTSPAQARRAIARGKLAVVLGMESSFPLGCHAEGPRRCTKAQVDRRLDALHRLGIRSMFIAHWADNGFAGAAVEGGIKGKFINAMAHLETGRWFEVGRCPDPSQGEELQAVSALELDVLSQFFPATAPLKSAAPPVYEEGRHCNVRGLTPLGRHLVRRMLAKGMLIEMDHLSERARRDVLELAERAGRPVVSGHSDTGGAWTRGELRRVAALGGTASQRLDGAAALAKAIVARKGYQRGGRAAVGLGTDTGGFATLPGPAPDAATRPLRYPFAFGGGSASFARQRTGERRFDLNRDGMAHYGLLPDLLADMARRPRGREAVSLLFGSAEAYVAMWEKAMP